MPGTDAFQVEGIIVEVLPNWVYRVELPNGHRLLGFVAGKAKRESSGLLAGTKVMLDLSPCDLSKGRILLQSQKNL